MPGILLTGFGPFERHDRNPSGDAVRALDGDAVGGVPIVGRVLDVSWTRAFPALLAANRASEPEVLLMTGVHNEPGYRAESLAHNRCEHRADIDGLGPVAGEIDPDAPGSIPGTLDFSPLIEAGPDLVRASDDAGGYLCNQVFYRALEGGLAPRIGFLHVPPYEGRWTAEQEMRNAERLREFLGLLVEGRTLEV